MIGLQSNNGIGEVTAAQAGMAIAGSNGLPVFSTSKQMTRSLRMAATTICLGLRRPACFRRATSAATAGLNASRTVLACRVTNAGWHRRSSIGAPGSRLM
jgi:hypothetical protein